MSESIRLSRRGFLASLAALPVLRAQSGKPMRGIFVIASTPYTKNEKLDYEDLAKQVGWLERCGAHGIVWPQRASEFDMLEFEERVRGFETIGKAAKGIKSAVVLGVQGPTKDMALRYLRSAVAQEPDALIAIPPTEVDSLDGYRDYYQSLAKATDLPIFIQTTGGNPKLGFPVELVLELAEAHSNLGYVKEEFDPVFERMSQFGGKRPPMAAVFSGAAGKGMLLEMAMGTDGTMPGSSYTDVYVQIWDAWQAGQHAKARAIFAKLLPLINLDGLVKQGYQYMMFRRGVFKTPTSRRPRMELTKQMVAEIDASFAELAPYLRV